MTQNNSKDITPASGGFFSNAVMYAKLVLRLMGDNRISPFLKVLPIGTVIYWIAPDLLPVIPLDDAAVIFLGNYLFIELCPPEVVEEHISKLRSVIDGVIRDPRRSAQNREDFVEGEYRDVGDASTASRNK